jgi:hypothetical protein
MRILKTIPPAHRLIQVRQHIQNMSSTAAPSTMKAISIYGKTARLVLDRPVPSPRPDQLLVKVHAVALVSDPLYNNLAPRTNQLMTS